MRLTSKLSESWKLAPVSCAADRQFRGAFEGLLPGLLFGLAIVFTGRAVRRLLSAGAWTSAARHFLGALSVVMLLLSGMILTPLQAQNISLVPVITTVAGDGPSDAPGGYSGDGGAATAAKISSPFGVAVDSAGNFYIADYSNNRIREVSAATGIITTVAGDGAEGYSGDGGPATNAELYNPVGVAVDGAGNLYIADSYNYRIREVNVATGIITTVAGGGSGCPGQTDLEGDGCSAISAYINEPHAVAVDSAGDLYIADLLDSRIREVSASTGIITTVAGIAGTGYSGDGGQATSAALHYPSDVALDSAGNLYIADAANNRIRMVNASTGIITTVAGSGPTGVGVGGLSGDGGLATSAELFYPTGVALDSAGDLYIADSTNQRIRAVSALTGIITTVAGTGTGNGTGGYSGDGGPATSAKLADPTAVALDSTGGLYIADTVNNRIRKVGLGPVNFGGVNVGANSTQTLYFSFNAADSGISASVLTKGATGLDFTDAGTGTCTTNGSDYTYTAGDICTMDVNFTPRFAGARYGAVVLLNSLSGPIATAYVFGTGEGPQAVFSPPAQSTLGGGFNGRSVAVDGSGNVYVADAGYSAVKEMPPGCTSSSCVTTLGGGFNQPNGVAVDGSGNVYVADSENSAVKEMPLGCTSSSCVTTLGGGFSFPTGVAVDASGNVYVADQANSAVKEMPSACPSSSCVTSLGGGFLYPNGVAVDGRGNVYVADTDSNAVKEMPPACASTSCVTMLGGGFSGPTGVAVDGSGDVYVADSANSAVYEMPPGCTSSACVTTLAGVLGGTWGVAVDDRGDVYFPIYGPGAVSELDRANPPSLTFATTPAGQTSSDSPQSVTIQNIGNMPLDAVSAGLVVTGPNFVQVEGSGTPEDCTASFSLAQGASCNLSISFEPQSAGPLSSTAVFTDNALNANPSAMQSVTLQGIGTPATPTVTTWPTASAIIYGQTLASSTLTGGAASVSGSFAFTTPSTLPTAGTQSESVTFVPTDTTDYSQVTNSVSVLVFKATPTVTWPTASAIILGQTLASSTLTGGSAISAITNATVPGSFAFTNPTTVPPVGMQSESATFTPTDTVDYASVTGTVNVQVNSAGLPMPTITWATPAAITYGTALSGKQLDATAAYDGAKVAGTFTYTPAKGTVLGAGMQTLSVVFTPVNTTDYTPATASVTLEVDPAATKISWNKPAGITYGTALSSAQLDATASVPGTFSYSPDAGAVLTAGPQTLSVTFTPTDSTDYQNSVDSVTITVDKAEPEITWAAPAFISYGTALSGAQLDATASVPGTFSYSPALGAVPAAGTDTLSTTFTPTDTTDYTTAKASVSLLDISSTPTITWTTPEAITYGTALSGAQLDATATYNGAKVAGTFTYTPAKGTVLGAGVQTLSLQFTPSNTSNYNTVSGSVTLQVNQATPKITWPKPAAITEGTALSNTQLDATASVPGTFTYTPDAGTVLAEGMQTLSVLFAPTDITDYTTQTATTTITVKP